MKDRHFCRWYLQNYNSNLCGWELTLTGVFYFLESHFSWPKGPFINTINFVSFSRCILRHCHCRCSCCPLPGLQVWWSAASPKQIWSGEKKVRGKKKTCRRLQHSLEGIWDLVQDTCWDWNRLVLTKEFNLGVIDSDRQICPWPVDLIFQAPYSYVQPCHSESIMELLCLWQLNLTRGNGHDGKGLLSSSTLVLFAGSLLLLPVEVVC